MEGVSIAGTLSTETTMEPEILLSEWTAWKLGLRRADRVDTATTRGQIERLQEHGRTAKPQAVFLTSADGQGGTAIYGGGVVEIAELEEIALANMEREQTNLRQHGSIFGDKDALRESLGAPTRDAWLRLFLTDQERLLDLERRNWRTNYDTKTGDYIVKNSY